MEWSGEPKMSDSSGTPSASPTRELAAIMFSDIAGYTAIMGRDERKALRALDDHRALLRTILPRFNGRLVGEIGDGTLSSFHSALDAVNCARAAQAALQDDPSLKLRIGIHLGDVVFSNNTVLGDGVNVASRIHALASPGAICISANVYDEIRNKPEFQVKDLGEQKFKERRSPDAGLLPGGVRAFGAALSHAAELRTASDTRRSWRAAARRGCLWCREVEAAGSFDSCHSAGHPLDRGSSAGQLLGRSKPGIFR